MGEGGLTFLHGVLDVLHIPQGFVRRPFAIQLGDFCLQFLVHFGFSGQVEPQTAEQRGGSIFTGQDDVHHLVTDTHGIDLLVASELVDENISLSGVFGFACEICLVLVLHRLLHPDVEGGMSVFEGFLGLRAR